jgi:hypothetical protein
MPWVKDKLGLAQKFICRPLLVIRTVIAVDPFERLGRDIFQPFRALLRPAAQLQEAFGKATATPLLLPASPQAARRPFNQRPVRRGGSLINHRLCRLIPHQGRLLSWRGRRPARHHRR